MRANALRESKPRPASETRVKSRDAHLDKGENLHYQAQTAIPCTLALGVIPVEDKQTSE